MADAKLEALELELEKARRRFAPYFYTIKNHYNGPDAPYWAPAYEISAGASRIGIVPGAPTPFVPSVTNAQT